MKRYGILGLTIILFLTSCTLNKDNSETLNEYKELELKYIELKESYNELLTDYKILNSNFTSKLENEKNIVNKWFNVKEYNELISESNKSETNILGTWIYNDDLITFFSDNTGYSITYSNPNINRHGTIEPFTYIYENNELTCIYYESEYYQKLNAAIITNVYNVKIIDDYHIELTSLNENHGKLYTIIGYNKY